MPRICQFNFMGLGHIFPTVPIVRELTRRGVEVISYGLDEHRDVIESSGALFKPFPHFPREVMSAMSLVAISTEWANENLPAILEDVKQQQPDLIITDSMQSLGAYVAKLNRLPLIVSTTHFVAPTQAMRDAIGLPDILRAGDPGTYDEELANYQKAAKVFRQKFGVEPLPPMQMFQVPGDLTLITTSSALQPASHMLDESYKFIGPMIEPRSGASDFAFDWIENHQAIYISIGTMASNPEFFQMCVEAFSGAPYRVVISTGGKDIPDNDAQPNIQFRQFVPQLEVLQHVDGFVTHGGWNSVNEALYFDVPLVVCPQGKDQFDNARLIQQLGAGRALMQPTIESLRESVDAILQESSFSEKATQIGDSLRSTGGAEHAANVILDFANNPNEPPS